MTEALKKLIEAVEAGTFITGSLSPLQDLVAHDAFSGSLDSAKALHEALLPGWGYMLSHAGAAVYGLDNNGNHTVGKHGVYEAHDDNPARSWLLVILKAKLAQDEDAEINATADERVKGPFVSVSLDDL